MSRHRHVPIDRRALLAGVTASFLAPLVADGQPARKRFSIGYLVAVTPEVVASYSAAIEEGLRDLGYVEGRNIVVHRRYAEGKSERLPDLAAELVRLKVDVIVATTNPTIAAAKRATASIPIVMVIASDPVGTGFVASLARPGSNITGVTLDTGRELNGKRMELLNAMLPRASRVAVLRTPSDPGDAQRWNAAEDAGRRLGIVVSSVEIRGVDDFEAAFATMVREHADGVLVSAGPVAFTHRRRIVGLAAQAKLPTVYSLREWVDDGGLMSYGPSLIDLWRRSATFVDKILRGTKPGDLPVEQPTKFELVINLRTARALGLAVPQSLLLRADQVIQ
jgi:putative ABC transport system substrate-binding protein